MNLTPISFQNFKGNIIGLRADNNKEISLDTNEIKTIANAGAKNKTIVIDYDKNCHYLNHSQNDVITAYTAAKNTNVDIFI